MKNWALGTLVIGSVLFMIAAIVYVNVSAVRYVLRDRALRHANAETAAEVLTLEAHYPVRSGNYCEVDFAYTVDGVTRQKNTRVGVDFCLIFSQGSQVTARYLPHDPQVADLIWGGYYDVELFAAALLDVGVVWMIVKIIRDSRKEQAARSAPVEE